MYKGKIRSTSVELPPSDDTSGKSHHYNVNLLSIEYNDAYTNLSKSALV